ncbi:MULTISPECIES: hypothetical protein [Caproicibacterium]|uniref:Uncharacterized protein n=1 Tax=Caproicibacterium argilliputei TaxID=3030016 RepID=A0AA97H1A1_9FIRM|nr:hypothetical protein [Caproicibacterium argilliputei]WOC32218.1 hypothetical protein PXC00_13680 [Caproicibacterium argilliputei]
MDDLTQKLSAMLNDPATMAQVQSIMGALGQNTAAPETPPAPQPQPTAAKPVENPLSTLTGLAGSGLNAETLGLVTRLAPMLASVKQEDDSTRLLHALRPLLGETRQKKLDEAVRLLQMIRVLPMLRQSGLLGKLL